MRHKHWNSIPKSSFRALLSDVLPYELPASLDNSIFTRTLEQMNPVFGAKTLTGNWVGEVTPLLLTILNGCPATVSRQANGRQFMVHGFKPRSRAVPLSFNIGKSAGGVRQVSFMHPYSQIEVANFYTRYADTILYFTNRSRFSIRHPAGIAQFSVSKDPVFYEERDAHPLGVEERGREYESIRSYFTYAKYSHIYKFHESAEFRRLERSYEQLAKADVTRCFDSIYTHSISWVTNGIELSKEATGATKKTFGGRFDKLLQASNDSETHGILIGPEVSRIFAEIILQEVDVRVEAELSVKGLEFGRDYEIRRFVDDYFVFCNSQEGADRILAVVGEKLSEFKLFFNDSKRVDEKLPLRSERSVAKRMIADAFRTAITLETLEKEATVLPAPQASTGRLLLAYKETLLTTDLAHVDLANYALVRLELEFESALRRWLVNSRSDDSPGVTERSWSAVAQFIASVVDVALSIYAGAVAASHSVKISRIAHTALKFMAEGDMPHNLQRMLQSKLVSELSLHVRRHEREQEPSMQALILLDSLASIEASGPINDAQLRKLLGIENDLNLRKPSAIAILIVLRYCQDKQDLSKLKHDVELIALAKIKPARTALSTESALLASGLMSSPYASKKLRRKVLAQIGLAGIAVPLRSEAELFFHWRIDDYYLALQKKRSYEVY